MSRIEKFFEKSVDASIIPQIPMNYDAVDYKIYVSYLETKVDELTAENAELRERLDKAVELPCRVGDTVYEKGMYEGDVYEHRISKIIFDAEKISFDCTAIGNSIFLTRAEAEARLKELQGGER